MDYLQKIRSSVAAQMHSVASQMSQALPGNPIFREYSIGPQIGSSGPGLCWKVYSGTKNSTKQDVSIWLFEKKQIENWVRAKREDLPEMLKRGIGQLTRLRHPRILTIERSLEESRDCFAFCTEPIYACLANCFGDLDNLQAPPHYLKDFELLDVEIRHGLFQICEALSFLHNDTKIVHCNVSPSSILVNNKGAWKLGGFDFCILGDTSVPGKISFSVPAWSQNSDSALCPELDYVSPELAEGTRCDTSVDMFSLGILALAAFNKGKPPIESQNSFGRHKENLQKLKQLLATFVNVVPEGFRDDVKMCVSEMPEIRPNAIQFQQLAYFGHPLLKTLNCLDQRSAMDNTQKMQFFKALPTILPQFPKRALLQKIFPHLVGEFATTMLIPFVLPSVFLIAECVTAEEFVSSILPSLVTIFPVDTPYQISLLLLQKVNLLLEKMPTADVKQHLLPLVYKSLGGENPKLQELALSEVHNVVKFVDREQMRGQLLPKLLRLMLESRDLSIRVQSMVCLAKLLPHMEQWMVADQLLPALPKVNSKDPGVLMAVLGIYKMVFESDKFGIGKDQCARSALPFLIATAVEPTLNLQQFGQFMQLVHKMLEKVESEQRQTLQQLSASQEEQRRIADFADFIGTQSTSNGNSSKDVDLGDLVQILGGLSEKKSEVAAMAEKGTLTLEEKRSLAAEKEGIKREGQSFAVNKTKQFETTAARAPSTVSTTRVPFALLDSPPKSANERGNHLDLLSEFLPNANKKGATEQQSPPLQPARLPASSSFTSFPALPQPNSSSHPIQRRVATPDGSATRDPFDLLGPIGSEKIPTREGKNTDDITAIFFKDLNRGANNGASGGKKPIEDLLR